MFSSYILLIFSFASTFLVYHLSTAYEFRPACCLAHSLNIIILTFRHKMIPNMAVTLSLLHSICMYQHIVSTLSLFFYSMVPRKYIINVFFFIISFRCYKSTDNINILSLAMWKYKHMLIAYTLHIYLWMFLAVLIFIIVALFYLIFFCY